jgi:phospholipid/cholesterol/gamma-HCH transport system substrate-binding protein
MDRTTLDLWVGIFVAAGIGALLVLALKVGNLGTFNAGDTYTLEAHFNNIGGLKVKAPIKSAGVVVGRVAEIGFDPKTYEATVKMRIDRRYQFPKDTTASILTSGLLGEQYIGLEPGGDEAMLKPGEAIKLTQSAVVLEQLIGQFLYSKAAEGGQPGQAGQAGEKK